MFYLSSHPVTDIFNCLYFLLLFFKTVYLIFGCFAWAFSSCGEWGLLSSSGAWASHCSGFSCFRVQDLGTGASVAVTDGLSSSVAYGIFPDQEDELVYPALAGRFLSTVLPGNFLFAVFYYCK